MSVLAGFIAPHPPLIVPEVGRGKEREIQKTIESYSAIAKKISALAPETVILISPHATLYADYIHVSPGLSANGNLRQFGATEEYRADYDIGLIGELSRLCEREGFPAGTLGEKARSLDHGTLVPLHFIQKEYTGFKLVRVSISGLSRRQHYEFGKLLAVAAENLGRKTVVVASGDLSHKLSEDGPYGFSPDGPKFDRRIVEIMRSGDFGKFFGLDAAMCESAAECGLRAFVVMAGALDKKAIEPRFYSYEGPFGVGYAISSFDVTGEDPSRDFLTREQKKYAEKIEKIRENEDEYVRLARAALEAYVTTGKIPSVPADVSDDMTGRRAGVFVSIKKFGELRGCIGTTAPTRDNIAMEIIRNAVSSGAEDPRFSLVEPGELPELVYSVDVLSPAEPVADKSELDALRYGVIVSRGARRGLLLPNLDGVRTVEEQLSIACQKAGIPPDSRYDIQRFEVVRHT